MKTLVPAILLITGSLCISLMLNARSAKGYDKVTVPRELVYQLTGYGTTVFPERTGNCCLGSEYQNDITYWTNIYGLTASEDNDNISNRITWTDEFIQKKHLMLYSNFISQPSEIFISTAFEK